LPPNARSQKLSQAADAFEPSRLTLAREWRGITKSELAEKVGLAPGMVARFESGQRRPDISTLARLSLVLQVPATFFARGKVSPIAVEFCHFRHLRAGQQLDRRRQLAIASLLGDVLDFLARHVTFPRTATFSPVTRRQGSIANIEERAMDLRRKWGLGLAPIDDLTKLLESCGVLVHPMPREHDEINSFSLCHGHWPMIFLVQGERDSTEVRMEMAHELGHLVMHAGSRAASPTAEAEADRFAAAFLTPARALAAECPDWLDWVSLQKLAERWSVPLAALIERGFQLDCLSDTVYRRALATLRDDTPSPSSRNPLIKSEGPSLLSRAFDALSAALPFESVASHLCLSTRDLAHITGCERFST
jgi:Zn-dependent peptidase ImmA (M78 family)/transcriptional regulator with XRE-family HTH domain